MKDTLTRILMSKSPQQHLSPKFQHKPIQGMDLYNENSLASSSAFSPTSDKFDHKILSRNIIRSRIAAPTESRLHRIYKPE